MIQIATRETNVQKDRTLLESTGEGWNAGSLFTRFRNVQFEKFIFETINILSRTLTHFHSVSIEIIQNMVLD